MNEKSLAWSCHAILLNDVDQIAEMNIVKTGKELDKIFH